MKSYHVIQRTDGNWTVVKSSAKRASSIHSTQKEAVEAARKLLAPNPSSKIVVRKSDGRILVAMKAESDVSHSRTIASMNTSALSQRIGQRLQRGRIMRGHSLRSLADLTHGLVSHTTLQKYEKGLSVPDTKVLGELARRLEVRPDFFLKEPGLKLEAVEYRKLAKLGKKTQQQLEEEAFEFFERYLEIESILSLESPKFPEVNLSNIPLEKLGDAIEDAAVKIRSEWKLGQNPIPNVHSMLEENGIKVAVLSGRDGFDGFSAFAIGDNCKIPTITLSKDRFKDLPRLRFTALHELGHLILKLPDYLETREVEGFCHRFSGSFMVPRKAFEETFGRKRVNIALPELEAIKAEWGISFAAIMKRANDLGLISAGRYKEYCIAASKKGWRGLAKEPGEWVGTEKSDRFKQLVFRALAENLISISKACGLLRLSNDQLAEKFELVG